MGDWSQLSCSPDEKYMAYDYADEANKGNFDINLLAVEEVREISLVKHPANDKVIGWVPGRKEFLFISDRSGTWDLWAVPVDEGKPSGPVKRIYTDLGLVQPMGFTQNGDCFFGFNRRNFNAYIAPFNTETGELKEKAGKSLLGSNLWIKWSPDGQYLTYIKEDNKANNLWQLTVQDLKTGEERKLADNLLMAMSPCWSPDGNSILVVGFDKNKSRAKGYKGGIYTVDVRTGQTTEILLLSDYKYNVPGDDAFPLSDIQWSLDGKSIFYLFFRDRLVKHDLETGEDKILYRHSHFERSVLNHSPDGKKLLLAVISPEEKKSRLFTIPVEGGKEKELCTPQEASGFYTAMWSPDGKYVYFTERKDGTSLWRIPAEGGTPQKVWHSKDRAEIFSIHPDGKQVALAIRERELEIRVIENLVQELEKIYK
jgi:Tol biopolymer transport system component